MVIDSCRSLRYQYNQTASADRGCIFEYIGVTCSLIVVRKYGIVLVAIQQPQGRNEDGSVM